MPTPDNWSNDEWESFIRAEIEEVASAGPAGLGTDNIENISGPFSTISSPKDLLFPLSIDHTLLKPEATPEQIDKLCDEAIRYGFKSCCVNGIYVKRVAERLRGSPTIACCVVGFPLGASSAQAKAAESKQAIADGAREIDTVIPLGLLLSSPPAYSEIYQHLREIIVASDPVPVKVIIETALLPTDTLKISACVLAAEAGATFVKTSTGFNGGGATEDDVRLMWKSIKYKGGSVHVKASGGVRTFESCVRMFRAGAERIGTSSGSAIMQQAESSESTSSSY